MPNPSTVASSWMESDPLAVELERCGLNIETIGELVERAAILEYAGRMTRRDAEAEATGGLSVA